MERYTHDEILLNIKKLQSIQDLKKKERTLLSQEINSLKKQIEYWEEMPLNQIKLKL